jgi:hypothetical protein
MKDPANVPVEFLLDSSRSSLQDLQLAALARSANLAKAVKSEIDQWVEQLAVAMLARWMMEHRETLISRDVEGKEATLEDVFPDKVA